MKIAIFDYLVTGNNPIGSCHLLLLKNLYCEHEFTVFAVEFENPDPARIHWVRIPAIMRPMALLFVTYHFLAPLYYWLYYLRRGERFDLIQINGCSLTFGDLSYVHFCNRSYMKHHWQKSPAPGPRGLAVKLVHWLHMLVEPWIFRRVREIVAPSKGLVTELSTEYRGTQSKIHMVHNPVDSGRMACPTGFDRECVRRQLGVGPDDLNIVFVSLGHFERKGLPQLLQALAFLDSPGLKLTVVGGRPGLVSEYRQQVIHMDLEAQVVLLGTKEDVRPYLWSADLFALPSHYEVFPLVALEAAAAGLPLLVTPLNGVEEFLVDGENGILVDATSRGLAEGIARFKALSAERRKAMGRNAKQSVQRYSVEDFVNRWREIYALADVNEH